MKRCDNVMIKNAIQQQPIINTFIHHQIITLTYHYINKNDKYNSLPQNVHRYIGGTGKKR